MTTEFNTTDKAQEPPLPEWYNILSKSQMEGSGPFWGDILGWLESEVPLLGRINKTTENSGYSNAAPPHASFNHSSPLLISYVTMGGVRAEVLVNWCCETVGGGMLVSQCHVPHPCIMHCEQQIYWYFILF